MISDLKLALRGLVKAPAFTAVAVLILMLGIGAITAVFSAVEAVLLRPFPFARSEQLYAIDSSAPGEAGLFSLAEYCAYRDETRAFAALSAATNLTTNLVDQGEAQLVQGVTISAGAFQMLGARPVIGRLLVPADDAPDAAPVVVIGQALWQRQYGGRTDVLGRTVSVNGRPRQVVGVLPASFQLPLIAFHSEICVPLQPEGDPNRHRHGTLHYLRVFGRLAPGASPARAEADLQSILNDLRRKYPEQYQGGRGNVISPLAARVVENSRPILLTLFGVVAALLLLASTNLAGLHLVRAMGRQREFAVRTALGASRGRLIRLIVAECLVLAVVGGAAGLLLANWGVESLLALMPADLPRAQELEFNGTLIGFAAVVSLAAGLLPAVAPLWLLSRGGLSGAMAEGGRGATRGQRRLRHWLASVQVALALAMLVSTALFLRSFWAAGTQRLGFDSTSSSVLTARLSLPEAGYADTDSLIRHAQRLHDRLAAAPGIQTVAAVSLLPLSPGLATAEFQLTGRERWRGSEIPAANYRLATPDYFSAMGIRLREGRGFAERDDRSRPLEAVVGQTLADHYFPQGALGQRVDIQDTNTGFRTAVIVGVVSDVKQGKLEDAPAFDLWLPYRQMDPVAVRWLRYRTYWVVRGTGGAAAMERVLRTAVHAEDRSIAIASVRTLGQVADGALATRRFTLLIIGFVAATALILTVAGIYSVIAFGVVQRNREIGVRIALGAQARQIVRLVLDEGMRIVFWGAPAGAILAFVVGRILSAQLYGVSPSDPASLAAALVLLLAVALLASWLPAQRASRIDPIIALRAD